MKRVTHAGGRRPSFRRGQRKYSVAVCGAVMYDDQRWRCALQRKLRISCKKCRRVMAARKKANLKYRREDRKRQLAEAKAAWQRVNVMRARFGIAPLNFVRPEYDE